MVLTVNSGDDVRTIRSYLEKNKFTLGVVRDEGEVSGPYGVKAYPTNYVIGPDGKVAERTVGFDEDKLRATLEKLAGKKD